MTQFPSFSAAAQFERVTPFDAPGVIFTQLVDGELTAGSAARALFDGSSLGAKERDSLSQRLKAQAGGTGVSNALVDIATNPWVWFMFATSAFGLTAVGRGAENIFRLAPKYHPFIAENGSLLHQVGGTTPLQSLRGTATGASSFQVSDAMDAFRRRRGDGLGRAIFEAQQRLGVKTLDPRRIPNPELAGKVERGMLAVHASITGAAREIEEVFPVVEKGVLTLEKVRRPALIAQDPDIILQQMGLTGLRDAMVRTFRETADELFPDEDAILRIYRGLANPVVSPNKDTLAGIDLVGQVLGKFANDVRQGAVTRDQFTRAIRETVLAPIRENGTYFPRNVSEGFKLATGKTIDVDRLRAATADARRLGPAGATIPRVNATGLFHPRDLEGLGNQFGATNELRRQISVGDAILERGLVNADEGVVRFHRLRPLAQVTKYVDDSTRTFAFFVDKPGKEVLALQKASRAEALAADPVGRLRFAVGLEAAGRAGPQGERALGARVSSIFDEVGEAQQPLGGFSMADAFQREFQLIKDPHRQRVITDVIVPRALGRLSVRNTASIAALHTGKQMLDSFVRTDAAKVIGESGVYGKRVVDRMRQLANQDTDLLRAGGSISRGLANLLYKTHLGVNLASVALNSTQPFLLASTFVGARNVLAGYGAAFREMGGYFAERTARFGLRPITNAQRGELVRNNFRFADVEGVDLLGATDDVLESLDAISFEKGGRGLALGGETAFRQEVLSGDFLLKPFEKAEMMNRNVAAHALARARNFDVDALAPGQATELREFVLETQFGSNPLNTPLRFQPSRASQELTFSRLLENPLMRQFFSFPLRSFTGIAETSRFVGGSEGVRGFGRGVGGVAVDVLRGMGVSAIMFEAGKDLIGVDLERAGFASATTEFPSLLLGQEGRGLVPPIVDIGQDVFKAAFTDEDVQFTRDILPRVVPGGIAVSRAIGVLPKIDTTPSLNPQRRFADYTQLNEEGRVPVFDANSGSLISFERPIDLVLEGLGVDLGRFGDTQQLEQFLIRSREQMNALKDQAINSLLSNNIERFQKIKNEFTRRFGVPMDITKQRLRREIQQRETPRPERILDTLPPEARPIFQQIVAQQAARLGLPPEAIIRGKTARQRDFARGNRFEVSPDTQDAIRRALQEQAVEAARLPGQNPAFAPFSGFER